MAVPALIEIQEVMFLPRSLRQAGSSCKCVQIPPKPRMQAPGQMEQSGQFGQMSSAQSHVNTLSICKSTASEAVRHAFLPNAARTLEALKDLEGFPDMLHCTGAEAWTDEKR